MVRAKFYVIMVVLSLVVLLAGGCASQPSPPETLNPVSQEESQRIAEEFMRNSPTFIFDGIEDTLALIDATALRCPYCWQFTFEFESRHAGYGDRTGQALAQVITPHRATIAVVQGEILYAVMDGKWNMVAQKLLSMCPCGL